MLSDEPPADRLQDLTENTDSNYFARVEPQAGRRLKAGVRSAIMMRLSKGLEGSRSLARALESLDNK